MRSKLDNKNRNTNIKHEANKRTKSTTQFSASCQIDAWNENPEKRKETRKNERTLKYDDLDPQDNSF